MASAAHMGSNLTLCVVKGTATPAAIGMATTLKTHAHTKLNLTRRTTAFESSVKVMRLLRSEETKMNFEVCIAISDPEPMAIPTSAIDIAGASLIPSPTIATIARCLVFDVRCQGKVSLVRGVARNWSSRTLSAWMRTS